MDYNVIFASQFMPEDLAEFCGLVWYFYHQEYTEDRVQAEWNIVYPESSVNMEKYYYIPSCQRSCSYRKMNYSLLMMRQVTRLREENVAAKSVLVKYWYGIKSSPDVLWSCTCTGILYRRVCERGNALVCYRVGWHAYNRFVMAHRPYPEGAVYTRYTREGS